MLEQPSCTSPFYQSISPQNLKATGKVGKLTNLSPVQHTACWLAWQPDAAPMTVMGEHWTPPTA